MNLYQAKNSPSFKSVTPPVFLREINPKDLDWESLSVSNYTRVALALVKAGYRFNHAASHRGYVNTNKMAVMHYDGRYGVGYAIMRHSTRSNNLYDVEYWVL